MVHFTKKLVIEADKDKVWEVFAHKFNDAYKWMASVPHSYAHSNGKLFDGAKSDGRICELTSKPDGMLASEQFLAYDEEKQTATVKIDFVNTPAFFPIQFNTMNFSIENIGNGQSEMTWDFRSTTKFWAFIMTPAIKKQFNGFVGNIMEELKYYVENDAPHPRKVKAMEKLASKQTVEA